MFVVIFHMLYLLGKYVYDNYRDRKASTTSNDDTEKETANVLDDNKVQIATNTDTRLLPLERLSVVKFSPPAYVQRYLAVANVLSDPKYNSGLRKIVDFGCAELNFLPYLKNIVGVKEILFVDVDRQILEFCKIKAAPLIVDHLQRQTQLKIEICEGSVTHNDKKLEKTDAVVCIELIEHLYDSVLLDVPTNIFEYIKPKLVIITTPNFEFNVLFPNLNGFRHADHKFEWTRNQFENWAQNIVKKYPHYSVKFQGVCYGPEGTRHLGACSQMAIFELNQEPNTIFPEVVGVEGLFQTIETYIYPFFEDDRSDTQKILDEVLYYINFLMQNNEESSNEIDLVKIQTLLKKCPISLEILRNVMYENGYTIEDRESGPVIILSEEDDSEIDEIDEIYTAEDMYIDEHPFEDEEELMELYDINGDAVYESNNWNEESIVIATNQVGSNHENSYLFDGEHLIENHCSSEQWDADPHAVDVHATVVVHAADATDVSTMISNKQEPIYQAIRHNDRDLCASNMTETNNVAETDDDIIMPDITNNTNSSLQAVSQDVGANLSSIQDNDAISNFQPYLSVSRSSTSPGLFFSAELDDSLISQNLLNNTFHRSEIPDKTATIVLPAEASSTNKALLLEEKNDVNFSKHSSLCYHEENPSNIEQNNDSMKHRVEEDISNDRMMEMEMQNVFSIVNDKPQSTSSPRCNKLRTTHTVNVVNQIVSTQENNHLYDGEHSTDLHRPSEELAVVPDVDVRSSKCSNSREGSIAIKQSCLEGDDLMFALESYTELTPIETINVGTSKDTSQESLCSDNIIAGTINHQATSNNKNATSKRETDANCSSSNNSQRELCLGSEIICSGHSTSVDSLQEDGNENAAGKENLIKHETDIVDVQKVDTHCVLSSKDVHEEYACRKSKVTAIKPCNGDTDTPLRNGSTVLAHSNISDKSLSPFRELSNTKSWSTSECSSVRAKENNGSDDSFKSCDEDTNNKVVQFAPPLRSDENVGCDTKDSTSKDVNTSSVVGLIAEAKLPSPAFESPPDSWSHEIVDSGYPNSASGQDITPENDLSSIAQDHIPDTESPSVAEAPRLGVLEPIEVENGDLANNNRDDEGNNMMAADAANDIEGLQPLIDVLENDLENENDIYALENGFPMWLLRILDMANPLDFDVQPQNLRVHHEDADVDYMDHDEGFDSTSSDE